MHLSMSVGFQGGRPAPNDLCSGNCRIGCARVFQGVAASSLSSMSAVRKEPRSWSAQSAKPIRASLRIAIGYFLKSQTRQPKRPCAESERAVAQLIRDSLPDISLDQRTQATTGTADTALIAPHHSASSWSAERGKTSRHRAVNPREAVIDLDRKTRRSPGLSYDSAESSAKRVNGLEPSTFSLEG